MEHVPLSLPTELRRLQLRSRRLVTGDLLGQYRSAFRGSGLVFSDLREYQPGDEVKQIHWKATARTGTVFVKSFEEDRQLRVLIAVDVSASMQASFGHQSRSKAIEFCALIGSLTQRGNDLLGLLTFADNPGTYLEPKAGPRRFSRLLSALLKDPETLSTKTDVAVALDHLGSTLRRSSIIFVVSDFECDDFSQSLSKLTARHDVILVQIQPPESGLLSAGIVTFRDAESGATCVVDTSSKRVQAAWASALTSSSHRIAEMARQGSADHIVVRDNAAQPLISLMRERVKRVSR